MSFCLEWTKGLTLRVNFACSNFVVRFVGAERWQRAGRSVQAWGQGRKSLFSHTVSAAQLLRADWNEGKTTFPLHFCILVDLQMQGCNFDTVLSYIALLLLTSFYAAHYPALPLLLFWDIFEFCVNSLYLYTLPLDYLSYLVLKLYFTLLVINFSIVSMMTADLMTDDKSNASDITR